jgi:hypothetical protein
MTAARISGLSGAALTVFAVIAARGLVRLHAAPAGGRRDGAHIFQLSILALVPVGVLLLVTADWSAPVRIAQRLVIPAIAVVLAVAALYYLAHYFYPAHYAAPYR